MGQSAFMNRFLYLRVNATVIDLFISNETLKAADGALKWQLYHIEKGLVKEEIVNCHVRRLYTEQIVHLDFRGIICSVETFQFPETGDSMGKAG